MNVLSVSDKLAQERRRCDALLARYRETLLAHPDVTGVGVGWKVRGGDLVKPLRYAIRISVLRKQSESQCRRGGTLLPRHLHHWPTDVFEARFGYCLNTVPESRAFHARPGGGCAIARADGLDQWGTLGIVVQVGGRSMYLTNKHVVGPRGSIVVQPPLPNRPLPLEVWQIGTVLRAGADDNRLVDCALVDPHSISGDRLPGPTLLAGAKDPHIRALVEGQLRERDHGRTRVIAWGAATVEREARAGIVRQTQAAVKFPDGTRLIRQIQVESMTDQPLVAPGDSGAVLLKLAPPGEPRPAELVGLVVGQYEEDDGRGILRQGLVANHIANVRRSLRFAMFGPES